MNVLIPVDRYRVDYEVGSGAPFSALDFLVLKFVANDGATELDQLATAMSLPRRLLIESLVGLARAGWVAIGGASGGGFTPTTQGRLALMDDVLPEPEQVNLRHGFVLVERLTGLISSNRDVTYTTTKRLMEDGVWQQCTILPRARDLPRLDRGQVKHLLQRDKKKEWIRWVGEPWPQQQVWLQVHIDEKASTVSGLPEIWRSALTMCIADSLRLAQLSSERRLESDLRKGRWPAGEQAWVSSSSTITLLGGEASHVATLHRALAEAQTQVLIASAFANADVINNELAAPIKAAIARGVRVDLLWGYCVGRTPEQRKLTINALLALRKACTGRNMLRFNQAPTGSHAKLLAWDTHKGFHVCVGSRNWLSARSTVGSMARELSVITDHAGISSDFCTTIAGLWGGQSRLSLSGAPDLWHHTAALLEKKVADETSRLESISDLEANASAPSKGCITMRQVRDQEHEALMRDMLSGATRRAAVISHKLGRKAAIRLASLPSSAGVASPSVEVRILAGEAPHDDTELLANVDACVRGANGRFSILQGLHAKLLLADDAVLISSYNFMSADPFGTATDAREVGLYIRGSHVADDVWAWIGELG